MCQHKWPDERQQMKLAAVLGFHQSGLERITGIEAAETSYRDTANWRYFWELQDHQDFEPSRRSAGCQTMYRCVVQQQQTCI